MLNQVKETWICIYEADPQDELTKCEDIERLAHEEHSQIATLAAQRRAEYKKERESAF